MTLLLTYHQVLTGNAHTLAVYSTPLGDECVAENSSSDKITGINNVYLMHLSMLSPSPSTGWAGHYQGT